MNLAEVLARSGRLPEALAQARAARETAPVEVQPLIDSRIAAWSTRSR